MNGFRTARRWNEAAASASPDFPAASHGMSQERPHAGKPRGAGERWAQILQRLPADDRLRKSASCTSKPNRRWRFESFKPQSRRRPLSSTPASPRRPHCNLALCRFAFDVAGWTRSLRPARSVLLRSEVTSSSSRRPCAWPAPSSWRRSSPSLPSSPYCPPSQSLVAVSYQHLRESQALHLDYYKRKEKKIFHVSEMYLQPPRTRSRRDAFRLAPGPAARVPDGGRIMRSEFSKMQKCL